jgi:hypothetical protein
MRLGWALPVRTICADTKDGMSELIRERWLQIDPVARGAAARNPISIAQHNPASWIEHFKPRRERRLVTLWP